jgi:predicted PurR-regulated permease PerM
MLWAWLFSMKSTPEAYTRLQDARTIDSFVRLAVAALFAYWTIVILQPFLVLIGWSIILVIALHPAFSWLIQKLHLPPAIAASLITVASLLVLLGPASWLGVSLGSSLRSLVQKIGSGELIIPPPREAVRHWPLIGGKAYDFWYLASTNLQAALSQVGPQLRPVSGRILVIVSSAGISLVKFLMAIIISGFLFIPGPALVRSARSILCIIATEHGDEFIQLVGATIRNLARGLIGVALLQALLVGVGLLVVGIPTAGLLSLLVFILGLIQIGSAIVLLPIVIWCFFSKDFVTAMLFAAYMLPVSLMDNVLRPRIMAHGLKTPALVILLGLLGGVVTHGLIGLFIGPIVLAVAWDLLGLWTARTRDQPERPVAPGRISASAE